MSQFSLSIIIPAYNEQHHIKACLDSIALQSTIPAEVIVVDNNSSDETVLVASSYPFVRVVSQSKRGISYARDLGFNASNTQYIGRIDADTILPNNWVEQIKRFYAEEYNKAKALTGGATFRNMPSPVLSGWMQKQLAFRLNWLALGHHIVWGSNMVLPASTWQKVKNDVCHMEQIHEDIDLAIHLHRRGVKIAYKPKMQVSAELKRIYSDKDNLWYNLKWWPRTLKRHGKKRWVISLFAAISVYVMARLARTFTPRIDNSGQGVLSKKQTAQQ